MKTDFETLKVLASYIIDLVKEKKMIEFEISNREDLVDKLATELGVSFSTDEDIRIQAIEEVEDKMGIDNMPEDIIDSEIFNHARKEIIKSFSGENLGGLYLVESLNKASKRICNFFLNCSIIDEVFGDDQEIATFLIKKVRQFNPRKN